MSNLTAVVLSPSVIVKKKIYVAAGKTHPENNRLTVSATSLVKCSVKGLRYLNLFRHSVAGAEIEVIIQIQIGKFKNCRSHASVTYSIKADGSGTKGTKKRR